MGGKSMDESELKRFGVSIEGDLLQKFDNLINQKGYRNRSEAIRDLVRDRLIQQSWEKDDQIVAGNILLFYDHHKRNLSEEMTKIQHDSHEIIMSTTHLHLDHANCLELIIVKGRAKEVQQLSNKLTSLKGVQYGNLTVVMIDNI